MGDRGSPTMQYRAFGATDLIVSELGFGCARLGGFFGDLSRADMLHSLRYALDLGITFFDTSDLYCQGESEALLGEAFSGLRHRVVIASKVGYFIPSQRRLMAPFKPLLRPLVRRLGLRREHLPTNVRGALSQNFSADYIAQSVDASLKRLRTDYLDLYQLHSPPHDVLERGDAFLALERLQQQGKIRYYGVSCERTEDALLCLQHPGVAALQLRLSLLEQSALDTVIPAAAAQGVAIIARECFAGGILTRPVDSLTTDDLGGESTCDRRRAEIAAWEQFALTHVRTLPEAALQFVLGVSGVSVALVGMRTAAHVQDNLSYLATPRLRDLEQRALCVGPRSVGG